MERRVTDVTDGGRPFFLLVVDEWDLTADDGDTSLEDAGREEGEAFLFPFEGTASIIGAAVGDDTPDANEEVRDVLEALFGRNPDTEAKWRAENVLDAALDRVCDETGWCVLESHVEPVGE